LALLPRGRNFGRRTQKGPLKKLRGRKNWRPNFYRIYIKRAEKGPNFFKTFVQWIICESSEMNKFSIQLYHHIILQFISFQLIFPSRKQISMWGRIFFPGGRIFIIIWPESLEKSFNIRVAKGPKFLPQNPTGAAKKSYRAGKTRG
jgi:hypothetical protein